MSSVLFQTYSDIEYIVVDGLSEDNTVSIIEEYSHLFAGRLRFLSEPDKGIYDAMNKGIQMATGDIIGILNSDDLLMDDDVLKDIALAFDDKTDAICGNLYFVDVNDVNHVVRIWKGSHIGVLQKVGILHILLFMLVARFMKNMVLLILLLMFLLILN